MVVCCSHSCDVVMLLCTAAIRVEVDVRSWLQLFDVVTPGVCLIRASGLKRTQPNHSEPSSSAPASPAGSSKQAASRRCRAGSAKCVMQKCPRL